MINHVNGFKVSNYKVVKSTSFKPKERAWRNKGTSNTPNVQEYIQVFEDFRVAVLMVFDLRETNYFK